ncbi:acyl-CoA dehydrogenase family protein [Nitriliruptoria bacterium AS10]|nr:acyl-CoA dehydrogenase family protein [Salsipaludibacter albus]
MDASDEPDHDRVPTTDARSDAPPVATRDRSGLGGFLDGDQAATRARARNFLVEHDVTARFGLDTTTHRAQVWDWLQALADDGVFAVGLPAEYGGESDLVGATATFEELAHGDLSLLIKAGVQFGLFGGAILHLGTEEHHERWLADIISGDLPGGFAMTERGHGSDVADLGTTATFDPDTDEFVVHTPDPDVDFKEWIGNAADDGRMAAVFAQLVVDGERHGVHCLAVPLRDDDGTVLDGITITDCGHKMGLNGVDNGRIWFDHVRVPRTNLLDRFGHVDADGGYDSPIDNPNRRFFTMLGTLVQGRVSIAGAAVGASKSALTIAVRHALRRTQFSRPDGRGVRLMDYPTHRRELLPRLARTYALHTAQQRLAHELADVFADDDVERRRPLEAHAAGMKAMTTAHATDTIQAARQACGGLGYLSENRLGQLKADTDVFTTFEGDNTVLLLQVAKALLSGFADDFGSLDLRGMVGFLTSRVIDTIVERTSVRTAWERVRDLVDRDQSGPETGLRNRDWQLAMLAWREEHVLGSLARRMERATDDDADEFAVYLACQDHMLAAARAHVERRVMEAFATAVDEAEGDLGAVLNTVCDLHALATIEADRGWFQEHQRLSAERSKAITRTIDDLCAELAPVAGDLVDAFRIPDAVLAAPIAT